MDETIRWMWRPDQQNDGLTDRSSATTTPLNTTSLMTPVLGTRPGREILNPGKDPKLKTAKKVEPLGRANVRRHAPRRAPARISKVNDSVEEPPEALRWWTPHRAINKVNPDASGGE